VLVFLVVVYEERDASSGKGFGCASHSKVRVLRHRFISGDVRDSEALDLIKQWHQNQRLL
jgi:hypothetical protein